MAPSVQGLAAGTYSALLQIAEQASGVTTQQVVGLTMVVRAPGATDGTIGLDQVMVASYPQSGGTLTPAVFTVSNQDASTQTYTVMVDPATGSPSDASIPPAQFTVLPGTSQSLQVQATSAKSLTFLIAASSGATAQVSNVALGASAAVGACLPTQLLPVVNQVDSVARSGYPLNVTLQAYDDCGNAYSDFTASVSIGNGTASALLAVRKMIDKATPKFAAPCSSYILAVPGNMSSFAGNDGERKQAAALSSRFQTLLRYNANQSGWAFERLSDLARVLRIPGTVNAKDPGNPKEVEVHSSTDLRYNPSDFERYLNEQAIPDAGAEERAAKQFTERFTKQSLVINLDAAIPDDMLARWVEQDARFRKTWERQRDDLNDQSGSGYDLALACFGIGNGLSDQQIVDLIVHHRRIRGEQRRTRLDYFQRTISRAAKSTGRPVLTVPGASPTPDAAPQSPHVGASSENDTHAAETNPTGQTQKAQLCDQISQILGVHILRLVKVPGKEPVYLMELEEGRIEFDVAKLTSQRAVNLAFAAKAGKIIPSFKPQPWRNLTQMMLDACNVVEGTDDLEFEGAAWIQIDKYLSENPCIPTLEGTTAHDKLKPVIHQEKIAVSATDLQIYVNISTGQNYSVKGAAAMLAALGAQAVRVRGHGFREQSRWALPVSEFDPNDYGQNISGSENHEN